MSTVLITGTNRGIGKGLVAVYLFTPKTTVIATVRDPSTAETLQQLPKATGSRLIIIKLDVASPESIESGIKSISSEHGITSLDVVIANAGIANFSPSLTEAPTSAIQEFVNVNAYGQLELYHAAAPMLRKSTNSQGKFVYISSSAGSLTGMNNILPLSAYGASKALGNYLFKWLSLEQKDVLVWSQHPGTVETERLKENYDALKKQGIDLASWAISTEKSAASIKQVIDDATLENNHGKFLGYEGETLPW